MLALLLSVLVSANVPRDGLDSRSLETAANASVRPLECQKELGTKRNLWSAARNPLLTKYCNLVSKALVLVKSEPARSLDLSREALLLMPGKPGAHLSEARALVALGKFEAALSSYEAARKRSPAELARPEVMHDVALCYRKLGRFEEALRSYQALISESDILEPIDRAGLLLEAAFVAIGMSATEGQDRSEQLMEEGRAYLYEARKLEAAHLGDDILAALAWLEIRSGAPSLGVRLALEARALGFSASENSTGYVSREEDEAALVAIAISSERPAQAASVWEAFLRRFHVSPHVKESITRYKSELSQHREKPGRKPIPK